MEKYGFVYLWRDKKYGRYYIGSHWGTVDDGYICSSSWMMQAYKRRPEDFKRKILKSNLESTDQTFLAEHNILKKIKNEELGKKYYNLKNFCLGYWFKNDDDKLSVRQKMSKSAKARGPSFLGKKHSEESKKKMSATKIGKQSPRKGVIVSEETKKKMSAAKQGFVPWNKGIKSFQIPWNKGKKNVYSKESLEKMSKSAKSRKIYASSTQKW